MRCASASGYIFVLPTSFYASKILDADGCELIADCIPRQIDQTVEIMRENITQVAERGERLDAMHDKTGVLRCFARFTLNAA